MEEASLLEGLKTEPSSILSVTQLWSNVKPDDDQPEKGDSVGASGKRGPYRKGIERRAAILNAALAAYSEADAGGPTLKSIAEKAGVTETAILHYFASREELFVAVLQARDRLDSERAGGPAAGLATSGEVIAHNAQTPGLVKLFAETAAAAASPTHPGHEYFKNRYTNYIDTILRDLQHEPGVDPERASWVGRILVAAADGLQLQWLFDPSIDMRSDLERLSSALGAHTTHTAGDDGATGPAASANSAT